MCPSTRQPSSTRNYNSKGHSHQWPFLRLLTSPSPLCYTPPAYSCSPKTPSARSAEGVAYVLTIALDVYKLCIMSDKRYNLVLPDSLYRDIKRAAKKRGITTAGMMRYFLLFGLKAAPLFPPAELVEQKMVKDE